MAPTVRIRHGNVTMFGCDINGGAAIAVQVPADTGTVVLDLRNNDFGADLVANDESIITTSPPGSPILQISKTRQVTPGRVSGVITGNRFSPYTEASTGAPASIRRGSTDTSLTISGNVFTHGVSGSPAVQIFEDYPTVILGAGIAGRMRTSASLGAVTARVRVVIGAGIAPRRGMGTPRVYQQQFVRMGSGIPSRIRAGGMDAVAPGRVRIVIATGIAGRMRAGGITRIKLELYPIRPVAVPQRAVFGRPTLLQQGEIDPAAVPQRKLFGATIVRPGAVLVHPTAVPQRARFGVPKLMVDVVPLSVPQRAVWGVTVVRLGPVRVRPVAIPQRVRFGSHQVVLGNPRVTLVAMPQRAVFGQTRLLSTLGESEAYGHVVGF